MRGQSTIAVGEPYQGIRHEHWHVMTLYNEERPHDSLGDLSPAESRQQTAGNSTFEMPA